MRFSDQGNGNFRNPILFADYSDPDVIRVGDTYYLTASSFNYTPGLPILTSRDLVNWKLASYALTNIRENRFDIPRHSEGVWAPSIRYHKGIFYIFYGMPDEGYYVVKTKDPLGKWDEPVCILEGKGLIDPCPFWDEDGRAYVIHGYAKSRIGFKSILGIFEINPDNLTVLTEDHFIFNGNDPKHPAVTIEGPKVYKRDGFYYILAPAGGVKDGYQVALRSKDIHGPYEIKKIMDTGNTVINGPHQGGLVDTQNGDEWFIHFQDRGLYGRICHLQPVRWKDGWPVIGVNSSDEGWGEPVFEMEKPNTGFQEEEITCLEATDYFKHGKYGLMWQWLGNHKESFCSKIPGNNKKDGTGETASDQLGKERDGLRLFALNPSGEEKPVIWKSANVLTQKIIYPVFETEIRMNVSGLKAMERAGICMTGGQYVTAYIERQENDSFVLKVAESAGDDTNKTENILSSCNIKDIICDKNEETDKKHNESDPCPDFDITWKLEFGLANIEDSTELYFQNVHKPLTGKEPSLKIYISFGEESEEKRKWHDLGISYTPSDHTWVGAKLGIYCLGSKGCLDPGYSDFYYVKTKEL